MKTISNLFKQDSEKFIPPSSSQDIIPIQTIWKDGIFKISKNKYSKTYRFTDINYAVASKEDKEKMFLDYCEILNTLDAGITTQITLINRVINKNNFKDKMLIPLNKDELDKYRKEYNNILLDKANTTNSIVQEKYITISIIKESVEDARTYLTRIFTDLSSQFNRIGSKLIELDATERIRLIHDFYKSGNENNFNWDMLDDMRKGHSFKDYICPESCSFQKDYFEMGDKYCRVLFLKTYGTFIKDSMITELTSSNKNIMLSMDLIQIPTEEAIKEVEKRRMGIETNIANWQRKQNNNNNFSAVIPYDMELQRQESKEFLEDLTTRDQRMFVGLLTIVISASSKSELDNQTESIISIGRKERCELSTLNYQQMDGLNTTLPYGLRKIDALRTLSTESAAVLMPFNVMEVNHDNGIYYGDNVISKNMIIIDRKELLNGNSFILGVSGSGKSFTAKSELSVLMLRDPNADIMIIDPEREYSRLVKALGGETIHISATSKNHINALDINANYGDGVNPIILKSEFVLSLCEQLLGSNNIGPIEKSIIDRCTASIYSDYQKNNYKGKIPTLQDFREELSKQKEPEANQIALSLELFSNGSLNTFAKQTNVDTSNRLICYDILDLSKELRPFGMLVVLDSILNRITENRKKHKNTYIFIDEIYLLFQHEYSANFLFTLWKRVRKYGAFCTGITQNIDDLLQSHTARTMLANSEFIVMLNQAATDRIELAELLSISSSQMSYISNVGPGQGLIKIGGSLVPFINNFPKDTELYSLMTTKPNEIKSKET